MTVSSVNNCLITIYKGPFPVLNMKDAMTQKKRHMALVCINAAAS